MTLLDDIRAEAAKLDALSMRKGRLTLKAVGDALDVLPPSARKMLSFHHHKLLCDALNAALDDASQPEQLRLDPKSRQVNDP